jgi:hypothetical protein
MASSAQYAVAGTSVQIVTAYGENRLVLLHNSNDHPAYIGGSAAVTTTTGWQFTKDTDQEILVPIGSELWAITGGSTTTISALYLKP